MHVEWSKGTLVEDDGPGSGPGARGVVLRAIVSLASISAASALPADKPNAARHPRVACRRTFTVDATDDIRSAALYRTGSGAAPSSGSKSSAFLSLIESSSAGSGGPTRTTGPCRARRRKSLVPGVRSSFWVVSSSVMPPTIWGANRKHNAKHIPVYQ